MKYEDLKFAMDDRFADNGELDVNGIMDDIMLIIDNDKRLLNDVKINKRRKISSIVFEAFKIHVVVVCAWEFGDEKGPFSPTSDQLLRYLKEYGYDWNMFEPLVQNYEEEREHSKIC